MSLNYSSVDEKKTQVTSNTPSIEAGQSSGILEATDKDNDFEVFKKTEDGVEFRTVGWPRASVIFLKIQFALGVLGIPSAFYSLGAVGGALLVVGWGAINTYCAVIQGDFRNRHPGCHTIADMAFFLGGPILRELCGGLFVIAYILCTGAGILAMSTGLNALSHHATCTVWWSVISTIVIAACGSVRKFHTIGWLTWVGFISIFISVLIVVIAVTTLDRPAAAPQTGHFELGYYAIAHPTFIAGMSATATIFISSAGSSACIPVIAEMKNPKDYRKALLVCMAIVNASYLSFSLVVYKWCGKWVASPSLGSAGQTIKMVSYGIGIPGLIASAVVYLHVAAKYLFVRFLRNSPHLQSNSVTHWVTWLSCTFGLSILSFVLASAIPIFNYLLALTGSICFAPLALILPGCFWLHDHGHWRKEGLVRKVCWALHIGLVLLGVFLTIAGTYATVQNIIDAYAAGTIGKSARRLSALNTNLSGSAFSCADNSNSS